MSPFIYAIAGAVIIAVIYERNRKIGAILALIIVVPALGIYYRKFPI